MIILNINVKKKKRVWFDYEIRQIKKKWRKKNNIERMNERNMLKNNKIIFNVDEKKCKIYE